MNITNKRARWIWLGCAILLSFTLLGTTNNISKSYVMPDELVELAESSGFAQIDDFYDLLPGHVDPPFVYGYLSKKLRFMSVAFWCRKKSANKTDSEIYYLVFASRSDFSQKLQIEKAITWSYPSGLTLFRDTSVTFEHFLFIDDLTKKGPQGASPKDFGVRGYYDGNGKVFCKYKDRWLVLVQNDR